MTLVKLVTDFVQQKIEQNNQNEIYNWAVNETKLPEGIVVIGNSNFEKNISLKYALHEDWLATENNLQRRGDLIQYYISIWGGIRGNQPEKMDFYRNADANTLISCGLNGIASWSKALVIHNPNLYAIYDVRVVASLNYIQLLNSSESEKYRFSIINGGRNKRINNANSLIQRKQLFNNWTSIPRSEIYCTHYLPLLYKSAEIIGTNISTIEMILFNFAPSLADNVFDRFN